MSRVHENTTDPNIGMSIQTVILQDAIADSNAGEWIDTRMIRNATLHVFGDFADITGQLYGSNSIEKPTANQEDDEHADHVPGISFPLGDPVIAVALNRIDLPVRWLKYGTVAGGSASGKMTAILQGMTR